MQEYKLLSKADQVLFQRELNKLRAAGWTEHKDTFRIACHSSTVYSILLTKDIQQGASEIERFLIHGTELIDHNGDMFFVIGEATSLNDASKYLQARVIAKTITIPESMGSNDPAHIEGRESHLAIAAEDIKQGERVVAYREPSGMHQVYAMPFDQFFKVLRFDPVYRFKMNCRL